MVPLLPSPVSGQARPAGESGLRRLAANLAHNINNTLTGVIGYLELALRETHSDSSARLHLQRSLTCSHRIAEMVRRILAFAFHPAGQGNLAPISLRRVTELLVGSIREPQFSPALTVEMTAESDGVIRANGSLLLLVLDQLISNAMEAMPGDGALTFRIWEGPDRRCLSITDNGPGMSGQVQANLFKPFFTTKCSGHLGLGLALSRDLIEAMGGSIQITSVEGQGTTVTLSFPPGEQSPHRELPVDERIGTLLSGRLSRYSGPHFSQLPAESFLCTSSYSI